MSFVKKLFCILSIVATSSGSSYATCTLDLMHTLFTEIDRSELSDFEKTQLDAIYKNDSLTVQERSKQCFEFCLESRLSKLPQTMKDEIQMIIQNKFEWTEHASVTGGSGRDRIIKMHGPKDYKDTTEYYAIYLHELEHVITDFQLDRIPKWRLFMDSMIHKMGKFVEYNEKLSMRAEWDYLNKISILDKENAIQEIISHPTLAEDNKKSIIRHLRNSRLSFEDYLEKEWEVGRYSPQSNRIFTHTQRMGQFAMIMGGGFFAYKGGSFALVTYCEKLQSAPTKQTNFFNTICKRIGF